MQVSAHTARVHLHGAAAGDQPLGASLPLDALLPAAQPSAPVALLLTAVQSRCAGAEAITNRKEEAAPLRLPCMGMRTWHPNSSAVPSGGCYIS